jgi:hypothetical protein
MLAMSISFPHLHTGNSVQPGTNKRPNTDMDCDLTGEPCPVLLLCTRAIF